MSHEQVSCKKEGSLLCRHRQADQHRSPGAAHRDLVERLAIIDGGGWYVSCGRDGTAKCAADPFDPSEGKLEMPYVHRTLSLRALAYTPAPCQDYALWVW